MSTIEYLQIYSDSDSCSHFRTVAIDLKTNDYAPPAIPLNTSLPAPAEASLFLELPVGWFGDWHPTPVRQWLIFMTGEVEFSVGDGSRCRRQAGDVVMLDDLTGKGHRTRVIGAVPVRMAAIHFS